MHTASVLLLAHTQLQLIILHQINILMNPFLMFDMTQEFYNVEVIIPHGPLSQN